MAGCEDEEVQSSLGEVAPDNIRQKYLYKNVKGLYKRGEANPVKVFMA